MRWIDPLDALQAVEAEHDHLAFLHSSLRTGYSGRYSLLAYGLKDRITSEHFSDLAGKLSADQKQLDNSWFGYLGYRLKNDVEQLSSNPPYLFDTPALCFMQFEHVLLFDHEEKSVTATPDSLQSSANLQRRDRKEKRVSVSELRSNMTKAEYLEKVSAIRQAIRRGDIYQANLTRKFAGEFEKQADPLSLYLRLNALSPSPYSAYLKCGGFQVISSSPEQFITITAYGQMTVRPIKGSAPKTPEGKQALTSSVKDKAENLMIVDLMRNDLSRSAVPGSVNVPQLFEINEFATIYHMATSIHAKKRPEVPTLEAVKACFPPGSMTGAPKIKAMEICSALEAHARGIYSGAIGWFGGDGSCDLSVIIRTLITDGRRFEFQVGGAIVHDSEPEAEWLETLVKAQALCESLSLDMKRIASL